MKKEKLTILFQGDSITDAERNREDDCHLGQGYAMMAASYFSALYPQMEVQFINKGISGNRTIDLLARIDEDCIALEPDIINILIGINDCWRRFDSNDPTTTEQFMSNYRGILEKIKQSTDATIILYEPFMLHSSEERKTWRQDLDPKINVVRELAREFKTHLIPLDGIFQQVSAYKEPKFWAEDGVHPTDAGHALIANELLKLIKRNYGYLR